MRAYHSVIVFLLLVSCAFLAGLDSFRHTRQAIVSDMNQALAITIAQQREGWITPDTIQDYRKHLTIPTLRDRSVVSYAVDGHGYGLCSVPMRLKDSENTRIQGFANCSAAAIFAMSDQKASGLLSLLAVLWAATSALYLRRHRKGMIIIGNMMLDKAAGRFSDLAKNPVCLTPMQQQLLTMFFYANDQRLSKQEICDRLWPKKPDASDTLYTLIRRLKPIIAEKGKLRIVSERGKDYRLQISD